MISVNMLTGFQFSNFPCSFNNLTTNNSFVGMFGRFVCLFVGLFVCRGVVGVFVWVWVVRAFGWFFVCLFSKW